MAWRMSYNLTVGGTAYRINTEAEGEQAFVPVDDFTINGRLVVAPTIDTAGETGNGVNPFDVELTTYPGLDRAGRLFWASNTALHEASRVVILIYPPPDLPPFPDIDGVFTVSGAEETLFAVDPAVAAANRTDPAVAAADAIDRFSLGGEDQPIGAGGVVVEFSDDLSEVRGTALFLGGAALSGDGDPGPAYAAWLGSFTGSFGDLWWT